MSEKINEELVRQIITKVVSGYQEQNKVQAEEKPPVIKTITCPVSEQDVEILVEASARHVHLTE
ncbi:MAG: hypothetical protein IKR02_00500, partial [Firmicutes bacterium]|nr:hypothetical protein [Bacillota bacterium]